MAAGFLKARKRLSWGSVGRQWHTLVRDKSNDVYLFVGQSRSSPKLVQPLHSSTAFFSFLLFPFSFYKGTNLTTSSSSSAGYAPHRPDTLLIGRIRSCGEFYKTGSVLKEQRSPSFFFSLFFFFWQRCNVQSWIMSSWILKSRQPHRVTSGRN